MISNMRSFRRSDAAEAVLVTRRRELLLIKRTVDYPLLPGGVWALFGGRVKPGETPLEAVRREVREELGVRLGSRPNYRASRPFKVPGRQGMKHTFAFTIGRDLSRLSLREGGGFALFTEGELAGIALSPYDRPDILDFLRARYG